MILLDSAWQGWGDRKLLFTNEEDLFDYFEVNWTKMHLAAACHHVPYWSEGVLRENIQNLRTPLLHRYSALHFSLAGANVF